MNRYRSENPLNPIEIMQSVLKNYQNATKWDGAELGEVKLLNNTHVGDVGQDFVREWCKVMLLDWEGFEGRHNDWDAKIEGFSFEIKTATEDVNGSFQFNHIRHHRKYQGLLCLGIAPDDVLFDAWTKGEVSEDRAGRLVSMDRGSSATWKLTKRRGNLRPMSEFKERIESVIYAGIA